MYDAKYSIDNAEEINSILRSVYSICEREGKQTNWPSIKNAVYQILVLQHKYRKAETNVKVTEGEQVFCAICEKGITETGTAYKGKPVHIGCYYKANNEMENIPADFKRVTGHDSPKEMAAYEKGREDEQEVIMQWIEKWDGSSNSVMGTTLKKVFEKLRKDNVGVWVSVEDDLPPTGTMVDGYNKKWIDEDFNPEGIRECFLQDEGFWNTAEWYNDQDCWNTDNSIPSHWKQRFPPNNNDWIWTDALVKKMLYSKLPIPDHYISNVQKCLDEFKKSEMENLYESQPQQKEVDEEITAPSFEECPKCHHSLCICEIKGTI